MNDLTTELGRAYARIEELEQENRRLEKDYKALCNMEWWETYRAALTGLRAFSHPGYNSHSTESAHAEATRTANIAHGELKP